MTETDLGRRTETVRKYLQRRITAKEASIELGCSQRTIRRYKIRLLENGIGGLEDRRRSNNRKLAAGLIRQIIDLKKQGPWRSCRHIMDKLPVSIGRQAVWRILTKAGLMRLNAERLKPLQRFMAKYPNDLWQSDVMGKMRFLHLGYVYLIASIDDHSRFVLSSNWYERQTKQNVFFIWYAAMRRWGIPKAMLQDRGSQYKANTQFGQADYQYYAGLLKIELIWAKKAQTKGKIERFWRFVQQDFVRENLSVKTMEELNRKWNLWVAWYNFSWRGTARGLNGRTPAQAYRPSDRTTTREEIDHLLVIEERRKVSRENTISLYGRTYRIPGGYIGARIWVKIKGNKLLFESQNRIFWKQRLKP